MANLLDTLDPIFADCLWKSWAGKPRYQIDVPWVADGWAYATDGSIAVRQLMQRKNTKGKFPPGEEPFEVMAPKAGTIITLPSTGRKRPDLVCCSYCRGRKQACSCTNGKVLRKIKTIAIGSGAYGIGDRYLWLFRDHGIKIVQPTTHANCYSFTKGRIEGRLMGKTLGDDDG